MHFIHWSRDEVGHMEVEEPSGSIPVWVARSEYQAPHVVVFGVAKPEGWEEFWCDENELDLCRYPMTIDEMIVLNAKTRHKLNDLSYMSRNRSHAYLPL